LQIKAAQQGLAGDGLQPQLVPPLRLQPRLETGVGRTEGEPKPFIDEDTEAKQMN